MTAGMEAFARRLGLPFLLLLVCLGAARAQLAGGCCELRVDVRSASRQPVPDAAVSVTGSGPRLTAQTNASGAATFVLPRPGTYSVSVSREGYIGTARALDVTLGTPLAVEFTLMPRFAERQSVTVTSGAPEDLPAAQTVAGSEAEATPDRPATLRDALPLIPGVIRTPSGRLTISEAAEHRNSLLVNSFDATDPATGSFGATVPIDSVVAFNVYKNPFLAEYGRFTSGVVTVETRGGGDTWRWELNDPTPELRIRSRHVRGIRGWTPRLGFSGPLERGSLYLSQSVEYVHKYTPVKTQLYPENESKRESWNSLTRLDWNASPGHILSLHVHGVPQRLSNVGIDFYNPRPVTPSLRGHEAAFGLSDRLALQGGLLESAVSVARVQARVSGHGEAPFVITPNANFGNYFMRQDRRGDRFQWLETWSPRPLDEAGRHQLKAGWSLIHARARGMMRASPIAIRGWAGQLLERIDFANAPGYRVSDWEASGFLQDHWNAVANIAVDAGLRLDRQSLTGMTRLAPRLGISWSPGRASSTMFRAGAGWFYDRVPLIAAGFDSYPERTVSSYLAPGAPAALQRLPNVLGTVTDRGGGLVFGAERPGNFAPRSLVWSLGVERDILRPLQVRATYRQGRASETLVLEPVSAPAAALVLGAGGRGTFRSFELLSRAAVGREGVLHVSYTNTKTRANVNQFSEFLGDFPDPLVRPDAYATASFNVPHRFLAWGVIPVTERLRRGPSKIFPPSLDAVQIRRGWRIAPVAEYRSGFPYTAVNERQEYAGEPYALRYPKFLSLDVRIAKDLALGERHAVQFSLSVLNITNHFNPESVRWNTADAQFGEFLGYRGRRLRVDFDILF